MTPDERRQSTKWIAKAYNVPLWLVDHSVPVPWHVRLLAPFRRLVYRFKS